MDTYLGTAVMSEGEEMMLIETDHIQAKVLQVPAASTPSDSDCMFCSENLVLMEDKDKVC